MDFYGQKCYEAFNQKWQGTPYVKFNSAVAKKLCNTPLFLSGGVQVDRTTLREGERDIGTAYFNQM